MLKRLQQVFEIGKLANYWHPYHNLFDQIEPTHFQALARELQRIINNIDTNIEKDSSIIKSYF